MEWCPKLLRLKSGKRIWSGKVMMFDHHGAVCIGRKRKCKSQVGVRKLLCRYYWSADAIPFDKEAIETSWRKRARHFLHEDCLTGGIGGELRFISENYFEHLDARWSMWLTWYAVPFAIPLEQFLPKERFKKLLDDLIYWLNKWSNYFLSSIIFATSCNISLIPSQLVKARDKSKVNLGTEQIYSSPNFQNEFI